MSGTARSPRPHLGHRVYRVLRFFLGPAQLGAQRQTKQLDAATRHRADTALAGMTVKRDASGHTYLVKDSSPG